MSNAFDPYREALVVEQETLWSPATRERTREWEPRRKRQAEQWLHATAEEAAELEYVRLHTGFCRRITVATVDLERLAARVAPPD